MASEGARPKSQSRKEEISLATVVEMLKEQTTQQTQLRDQLETFMGRMEKEQQFKEELREMSGDVTWCKWTGLTRERSV
ncbi:Hypothetical predicted protein [Octopus vulgaris]|uniref:Uncharacterized protein n=1 Tax=Octopus vulgaris TaxID=6645 RepID=A0AA36BJM8_OCTVU|nr:Hypothetical predicted protein [Octopus vulgaris]